MDEIPKHLHPRDKLGEEIKLLPTQRIGIAKRLVNIMSQLGTVIGNAEEKDDWGPPTGDHPGALAKTIVGKATIDDKIVVVAIDLLYYRNLALINAHSVNSSGTHSYSRKMGYLKRSTKTGDEEAPSCVFLSGMRIL